MRSEGDNDNDDLFLKVDLLLHFCTAYFLVFAHFLRFLRLRASQKALKLPSFSSFCSSL